MESIDSDNILKEDESMKFVEKTKNFVKKHKDIFIMGAATGGAMLIGCLAYDFGTKRQLKALGLDSKKEIWIGKSKINKAEWLKDGTMLDEARKFLNSMKQEEIDVTFFLQNK